MTGYECIVILRIGVNAKDYEEAIKKSTKLGKKLEEKLREDYPTFVIGVGVEEQNLVGEV